MLLIVYLSEYWSLFSVVTSVFMSSSSFVLCWHVGILGSTENLDLNMNKEIIICIQRHDKVLCTTIKVLCTIVNHTSIQNKCILVWTTGILYLLSKE